jgi:hypothetical protein
MIMSLKLYAIIIIIWCECGIAAILIMMIFNLSNVVPLVNAVCNDVPIY